MKIVETTRIDGKFLIEFEDGYKLDVDDEEYFKFYIYDKSELSLEECENIKRNTLIKKARSESIKFISYKIRSSMEVKRKLQELGYEDEVIEKVISALKRGKYLDDFDYAGRYARTKIKTKTISRKQLEFELIQKGIEEEIINSVLETNSIDEYNDALKIATKKLSNKPLDNKSKLKIMKHLYSKGYATELINRVVNELSCSQNYDE